MRCSFRSKDKDQGVTEKTMVVIQWLTKRVLKGPWFGFALLIALGFILIVTVCPTSKGTAQTSSNPTGVSPEDYDYGYPHAPDTSLDIIPYKHFDSEVMYQTDGSPSKSLMGHELSQLTPPKEIAQEYLRKHMHEENVFVAGRYRWLPEGVEYDLSFKDLTKQVTNKVMVYQKLEQPKVVRSLEVNDVTVVNIVITIQGRMDKYSIFLDHLVNVIIPKDPNVSLTVVYFSDKDMEKAKDITKLKMSSVPNIKWTFIPLEDESFSRGRGLHVGADEIAKKRDSSSSSSSSASEILFFCDVDILMLPDFPSRCRSNTLQGQQVYYPIVFSLYNPRLVYPLVDKEIPSIHQQLTVTEQSGFWRVFGFGMTCMYASDYQTAGGFPDIRTWGVEDESLYEKFLQMDHIKVVRSPDPSLFHLYHRKDCPDVTSTSYPSCLKSKALTEGSQLQLGLALLKLHEGTDLEGILSKRFYYFWLVPYLACFLFLSLVTNILQATAAISSRKVQVFQDVCDKRQL